MPQFQSEPEPRAGPLPRLGRAQGLQDRLKEFQGWPGLRGWGGRPTAGSSAERAPRRELIASGGRLGRRRGVESTAAATPGGSERPIAPPLKRVGAGRGQCAGERPPPSRPPRPRNHGTLGLRTQRHGGAPGFSDFPATNPAPMGEAGAIPGQVAGKSPGYGPGPNLTDPSGCAHQLPALPACGRSG